MTNGHLNIIQRSLKVVDKLIIGVADNLNKKPLLSIDERKNIIANDIYSLQQNNKKIEIHTVNGLLTEFAKKFDAEEAEKIGLVDGVEDIENIDRIIQQNIASFLKVGPQVIKKFKNFQDKLMSFDKIDLEFTISTLAETRTSDEAKEGLECFLKKKNPSWVRTLGENLSYDNKSH